MFLCIENGYVYFVDVGVWLVDVVFDVVYVDCVEFDGLCIGVWCDWCVFGVC